jgi:hypothetical protein
LSVRAALGQQRGAGLRERALQPLAIDARSVRRGMVLVHGHGGTLADGTGKFTLVRPVIG